MRLRGLLAAIGCLLALSSMPCAALASSPVEACLEQTQQAFVGQAVRRTFRPSPLAYYDDVLAGRAG